MEYAFSILMLCFAGMLLLYAGILALSKDTGMIPRMQGVKVQDKKAYARQFAKMIALVALAPATSALTGLIPGFQWLAVIQLILGLVVCIWAGVKLIGKVS